MLFDRDHVTSVNDRYSDDVGDLVLQEVAGVVRRSLNTDAVVGRWAGEECLVVLPRADLTVGASVAQRLRRDIADHAFPGGLDMTASFGASVVTDSDSVDAVLVRADRLRYVAKEGGRDLVTRVPRAAGIRRPRRAPVRPLRRVTRLPGLPGSSARVTDREHR